MLYLVLFSFDCLNKNKRKFFKIVLLLEKEKTLCQVIDKYKNGSEY